MLQAEIFRLHGQLLAAVEDNDAANKAFATSLALWPQLAEGWLSWGTFCDKQVGPPLPNFFTSNDVLDTAVAWRGEVRQRLQC